MFTPEDRDRIRERVFAIARADERITGGAVTGSRSVGAEDRWSDVDTAFGVTPDAVPEVVLGDWTALFEREFDVVHHFDLRRGSTFYRVFLLANSLEVDVSLTPAAHFGARGASFQLVFGDSADPMQAAAPDIDELIGYGWIYVLNARAALARCKPWQAEYWISGIRDQGLALACVRHNLPPAYARAVDRLDPAVTMKWGEALVRSLDQHELSRALTVAVGEFVHEVGQVKPTLAQRLHVPLSLDAPT